jgi:hypothetical protein
VVHSNLVSHLYPISFTKRLTSQSLIRTFHEQQCAKYVVFLLPIQPSLKVMLAKTTPELSFKHDVELQNDAVFDRLFTRTGKSVREYGLFVRFARRSYLEPTSKNSRGTIHIFHRMMKRRHNRVLSDRIQILANLCELK